MICKVISKVATPPCFSVLSIVCRDVVMLLKMGGQVLKIIFGLFHLKSGRTQQRGKLNKKCTQPSLAELISEIQMGPDWYCIVERSALKKVGLFWPWLNFSMPIFDKLSKNITKTINWTSVQNCAISEWNSWFWIRVILGL